MKLKTYKFDRDLTNCKCSYKVDGYKDVMMVSGNPEQANLYTIYM